VNDLKDQKCRALTFCLTRIATAEESLGSVKDGAKPQRFRHRVYDVLAAVVRCFGGQTPETVPQQDHDLVRQALIGAILIACRTRQSLSIIAVVDASANMTLVVAVGTICRPGQKQTFTSLALSVRTLWLPLDNAVVWCEPRYGQPPRVTVPCRCQLLGAVSTFRRRRVVKTDRNLDIGTVFEPFVAQERNAARYTRYTLKGP
jgi:hypothetical protein